MRCVSNVSLFNTFAMCLWKWVDTTTPPKQVCVRMQSVPVVTIVFRGPSNDARFFSPKEPRSECSRIRHIG